MDRAIVGGVTRLARETNRVFVRSGIVGRHFEDSGCVGYEYTLPTSSGPLLVRSVAPRPQEVGGKIGRRIKRRLKKMVKSRAFKALVKVAKGVASVVPGGAAVVTAATIAEKAAKAVMAAKRAKQRGNLRPMKLLGPALKRGAMDIRRLAS